MLDDLIRRNLANGLADFEGLHIEGSIPVKTELINSLIADVLANGLPTKKAKSPTDPSAPGSIPAEMSDEKPVVSPGSGGGGKAKLDRDALQSLVQKLITRAEISAENGAITFHFEARR